MFKNFLVLISIIFLPAFSFAADVSKLFSQGSYDTAFRVGYADALGGDPESSYIIGRILVEGKGSGKENISKGIDFLKSSANSNYLKAVEFLADNYYKGDFTSEDKSLALKYYEQAEKLGSKRVTEKVTELRIALLGKISKKSCVRYNKKNKKHYFKIAECISRDFLDGNASSYYLMAFDNGDITGKENVEKSIAFLKTSAQSGDLKAAEFLADNYYKGDFTSEDKSLALKYYEQAEKLGSKRVTEKVTELRIALLGKISKKSCVRYNKKNKKHYFKIAECISRDFLDGNASSFYLMAFDNGNTEAYLKASQRMLRVKDIDLMPLVKRIPAFKDKANKSEQQRFIKQIKRFGYDGSFCGKTEIKSTKKDIFAKPKKSTSSNSAACALAAEAGDAQALPVAYEWWKNGSEGFPRSSRYAQGLIAKLEENEDVDVVRLLRKFESNPKKHFRKAMEYISANPLNLSEISKELKLEIGMIADKNYMAFASNYRDIANVIEYIDWKTVDTQTLAKFYISYYFDLLLNHDHGGELTTPRVKNNINKIPYNKSFISSLGKMEGGGELANAFLNTAIFNDCDALNYALKNRDSLNLSYEIIQDARDQSLNKCDFAIAKKSMKELLEIAKRDIDAARPFVEKRLNHRLPCKDFSDFLTYNMNPYDDFDVNYERLTDQCADFPIVSYQLAEKAYNNKDYDLAYDYALQGCENTDHKSKGCDLLALIIIKGETINVSNQTYDERMQNAISYLTVGHESKDIDSTAFLHDISNKPILFSRFSDNELAKELIIDLEKSKDMSAKIQVKKNCFSADPLKSLFKNCKPVCAWAKRNKNNDQMGIVDKYLLNSIFKKPACNPQTN